VTGLTSSNVNFPVDLSKVMSFAACTNRTFAVCAWCCGLSERHLDQSERCHHCGTTPSKVRLVVIRSSLNGDLLNEDVSKDKDSNMEAGSHRADMRRDGSMARSQRRTSRLGAPRGVPRRRTTAG